MRKVKEEGERRGVGVGECGRGGGEAQRDEANEERGRGLKAD